MNKSQLIDVVALKSNLKKKEAEVAVSAVFDAITEALAAGDKVQIFGFGGFETKVRPERDGRNPFNGQPVHIPASKAASFSAAKALKDALNK